jgi:prevent-host-death family protein
MKTASVSHTRNHLSALLDQVRQGETVVITDHDRPVARITSIEATDVSSGLGLLERKGVVRRGTGRRCPLARPLLPAGKVSAVALLLEERAQGR